MKERNIIVTLNKAKEQFNSGNATLKEIALQAFSKEELIAIDFTKIKTFEDACNVLNLDRKTVNYLICVMTGISRASVAMFKLNIIRKALNLGRDLHLTQNPKNSNIYYPHNPFMTENSTNFEKQLNSGEMEIIGKIKSEGILYNVLSSFSYGYGTKGLGCFYYSDGAGTADANFGFLGCASKEIVKHFSKYFGMLITEAKFGDLPDFEIIESKY